MLVFLAESWDGILALMDSGGRVLWVIAAVLTLMWGYILERMWLMRFVFPGYQKDLVKAWDERVDTTSWYAKRIREAWLSEASQMLKQNILVIKTLVAICPLVGLLGTVTGMIEVFEVMANQGTSNPRLMAAGISKATIPTMAGMVAALSGLFISVRLEQKANVKLHRLADNMPHH